MRNIIVYSQPDCPPCEITKKFLSEFGFSFTEKNIKADKKAREELINKYQSYSTPTIIIDNQVIRGFILEELKQALNIE